MKKPIITLLIISVLGTITIAQQRNQLQFDWNNINGSAKTPGSISLSWYHPSSAKSGITYRLIFMQYEKENKYTSAITNIFQADVAKRQHIPLTKKVHTYVEAGISGMIGHMQAFYRGYYRTDEVYPCYCLVGGESGDFIEPLIYPDNLFITEDYLLQEEKYWLPVVPGIMLGTGLSIDISKKMYTGVHADIRSYYNPLQNEVLMYLRSGLHIGFKF